MKLIDSFFQRTLVAALAATLGLAAGTASAQAVNSLAIFRTVSYWQSSDTTVASTGAFFAALAYPANPTQFDQAFLNTPVDNGLGMNFEPGAGRFVFQTPQLPDQATMDTLLPTGTYTFHLASTTSSDTAAASMTYGADLYPGSLPSLTGTSYSRLQGMNAAAAITLDLSAYTNTGAPNEAGIFLSVYDTATGNVVWGASFLPASTTSITIPGGSLLSSNSYVFDLDYSNRVYTPSTGTVIADGQLGFDARTAGAFTTAAVPEPGTAWLWAAGLLSIPLLRRRRPESR